MNKDPSSDIYRIMDEAGLSPGNFLDGKRSMSKIVSEMRMKLLNSLVEYIKQREEENNVR